MKSLFIIFFITIFFSRASVAASGFDVITMNNGDIHNGIIDNQSFNFKTSFGEVLIPYSDMAELYLSNEPLQDRLVTHNGDIFTGDIQGTEINLLRTLDPTIPVDYADISDIQFSIKNESKNYNKMTEVVSSRYGDLFSAQFLSSSIKITTTSKTFTIKRENIHSIDIDLVIDDEETRAQIRTKDNQVLQGQLNVDSISFKSPYQKKLQIKHEDLYSVTFVNSKNYFSKLIPAKLNWQPEKYFRDQLSDKAMGPELIKLKPANFMRGDNNGDDDERPAMPINLKAFAIGSHEITFSQYDQFCHDTRRDLPDDQEWGRGSRPVVNVSWKDAVAYTQWLSKKTGKTYRLPTDAEWEYAARAGATTRFWWGNESEFAMANCEGCESIWSGEKTAPIGRFPANEFGLYDTAGNVFEWVADCYHNTFEHAPKDGSAIDKPGCGKRVIRGGAWSFPPKEIRSANRWRDFPTRRSDDTGFRVVRELE